jgi:hypothetical protein
MNVEIGTEAAQFPEKEYINEIFLAVWVRPLQGTSTLGTHRLGRFSFRDCTRNAPP